MWNSEVRKDFVAACKDLVKGVEFLRTGDVFVHDGYIYFLVERRASFNMDNLKLSVQRIIPKEVPFFCPSDSCGTCVTREDITIPANIYVICLGGKNEDAHD